MESCPNPIVDFESNLESNKIFYFKKYQSYNQQKCIDCLKPRSNKIVSVKNVVAMTFMYLIIKVFHL